MGINFVIAKKEKVNQALRFGHCKSWKRTLHLWGIHCLFELHKLGFNSANKNRKRWNSEITFRSIKVPTFELPRFDSILINHPPKSPHKCDSASQFLSPNFAEKSRWKYPAPLLKPEPLEHNPQQNPLQFSDKTDNEMFTKPRSIAKLNKITNPMFFQVLLPLPPWQKLLSFTIRDRKPKENNKCSQICNSRLNPTLYPYTQKNGQIIICQLSYWEVLVDSGYCQWWSCDWDREDYIETLL